ncbi:UrcA family protein [uncultured Caulobacter sp.]|jgi:UrcA family protein|uniref:UrcA family protein n=1 Tax=uncultured Caulobacter sp. TaxID=158749 RepID=UPI00260F1C96|nr:UrcA family protein [uncultured Caulobacter sp.]
MRKFIMSLTTVASLSLAAVPVLGLTQAANAAERAQAVHIAYGDLNLANPAQAKIFRARVDSAGSDLCLAKLRAGELATTMHGCVAEVHREVKRQLPAAQVRELTMASRADAVEFAAK